MKRGLITLDDYPYGYCQVGHRFHALKSGKRSERVSWIAALKENRIFAPMTNACSCNRDLFELWLEQCLRPAFEIQPSPINNTSIRDDKQIHQEGWAEF